MKKIIYSLSLLLAFVCVSCKEEVQLVNMEFSSELEQPVSSDSTKNYLSMERYVYWNEGDKVFVFAGENKDYTNSQYGREAIATPLAGNPQFASISVPELAYENVYYGIYPSSCADANEDYKTINMPTQYQYNRSGNIDPDLTFPAPGIPMVAYQKIGENSHSELPHLDFHSVVGVARIEIANNTSEDKTVTKVKFSDLTGYSNRPVTPISGKFTVNNIEKYDPYLTYSGTSSSATSIEITNFGNNPSPLASGKIMTIYLPLPATTSNQGTNSSQQNYKDYYLKMEVFNGETPIFTKGLQVKIRRNTLSYLPAIVVTDWSTTPSIELVGHGTQLRPFQIYSAADLAIVRNAMNPGGKINGQTITENTYFSIVHTFSLTSENWTSGIQNFKGHLTYHVGLASGGNYIETSSNHPIFESISSYGDVDGLVVKGTSGITPTGACYSPVCNENEGTMKNCSFMGSVTTNSSTDLAGLCVTNKGTMENCANLGDVYAQNDRDAAGICFYNEGTIQGFDVSSGKARSDRGEAASICHTNRSTGVIQNSQSTLSYGTTTPIGYKFGGIAFVNEGTIKNCEVLGSIISTTEVGGICHTNKKLIDRCRVSTSLISGASLSTQYVGGVAAYQENSASEIINCFNNSQMTANIEATGGICGGIVGYLQNGNVANCYTNFEVSHVSSVGYGMIVGKATGGLVENCYSGRDVAPFYHESYQSQIGRNCFCTVNSADADGRCCTYEYSTGKIKSLTTNSSTLDQGVTVDSDNMGKALNKWVTANQSSGKYLNWTESGRPTFTTPSKKR